MACFNFSACYAAQEKYDKALEVLDKAQQYAPDDPEILRSRAVTYACAGRIPEALSAFEAFRRRWPRYARRFDTTHTLRKLHKIKRGELPTRDYLVDYLQEQISHNTELGDFHLVEDKARRMIEANPNRPEGHFALGLACLEQDRYTEALEPFLTAHQRNPDHTPTLHNIGLTYLELDKPKEAISWLRRAHESDPEHLGAMYQLGVAYARLEKPEMALTWWHRVLELAPDHYPAQARVHEMGEGPEPTASPLSPQVQQIKRMKPMVKANMRHPRVYRNGGVVLTYDPLSFVLEDAENPRNATLYSGIPVSTRKIPDHERSHLLDLTGMVKMLLSLINAQNTRRVAILTYYANRPVFHYEAHFAGGESVSFNASGQFVVTEIPRFFKLKIDSDLATPYGDPMQGMLIYLNQKRRPGLLLSTLPQQGQRCGPRGASTG
jgi:tetratricopeptide (TPR) repeat protein